MIFVLLNFSKIHLLLIHLCKGNPLLYSTVDCALLWMIYLPTYCLKNNLLFLASYCALTPHTYQALYNFRQYCFYYLLLFPFLLSLLSRMLTFECDTIAYFLQALTLFIVHLSWEPTDRPVLFGRDCSVLSLFKVQPSLDLQPWAELFSFLSHTLAFRISSLILC